MIGLEKLDEASGSGGGAVRAAASSTQLLAPVADGSRDDLRKCGETGSLVVEASKDEVLQ